MSLLDIHVLGSPILRQETERVTSFTPELRRLVDDMFETMHAANGIGLAAPQVGRRESLFVAEVDDTRLVVINPELVLSEGLQKGEEGCLSIPEVFADVERANRVVLRAHNADGQLYEVDATELLARCLLHEFDHLRGKMFVDRLSILKKRRAMRDWDDEKDQYPKLLRVLPVGDLPKEKSPPKERVRQPHPEPLVRDIHE
ncbi:MAG: peptide deformylase [Phycisphaerae bacterium]|nr:peptide deformylase [Gemmatimonadaceae bacterium]